MTSSVAAAAHRFSNTNSLRKERFTSNNKEGRLESSALIEKTADWRANHEPDTLCYLETRVTALLQAGTKPFLTSIRPVIVPIDSGNRPASMAVAPVSVAAHPIPCRRRIPMPKTINCMPSKLSIKEKPATHMLVSNPPPIIRAFGPSIGTERPHNGADRQTDRGKALRIRPTAVRGTPRSRASFGYKHTWSQGF